MHHRRQHASAIPTLAACFTIFALVILLPSREVFITTSRRGLLSGTLGLVSGLGSSQLDAWGFTAQELQQVDLFKAAAPSVLGIVEAPLNGAQMPSKLIFAGSGFVWDQKHIVTNYHVIDDMKNPHVTFISQQPGAATVHTTVAAVLVGADPLSDIAVLEVDTETLPPELMKPLLRGTSSKLKTGQQVYALGNPFGLEQSMSRGIISGLARTMAGALGRPITNVIQTDASINPGNSGGPLLDSSGMVIGVNTAILSISGTFGGVSLAIPIDTVEANVKSMLQRGFVSRPSLGVSFAPPQMVETLGVGGAMVMKVYPGSPAQQAGLRAMTRNRIGDIIVGFDGKPVSSSDDLFRMLENRFPGEKIDVVVQRPSSNSESDEFDFVDLTVRLGASNSKIVI